MAGASCFLTSTTHYAAARVPMHNALQPSSIAAPANLPPTFWKKAYAWPVSMHMRASPPAQQAKGSNAADITHVYHCAYLTSGDPVQDCETNLALLRALVEGAEGAGAKLQHVFCMSGTKWYGEQGNYGRAWLGGMRLLGPMTAQAGVKRCRLASIAPCLRLPSRLGVIPHGIARCPDARPCSTLSRYPPSRFALVWLARRGAFPSGRHRPAESPAPRGRPPPHASKLLL
jgi:hypothetical protein